VFFSSANFLLLIDSLLYQIGYHMYIRELRDSVTIALSKILQSDNNDLIVDRKSDLENENIMSKIESIISSASSAKSERNSERSGCEGSSNPMVTMSSVSSKTT
jgi:hypothetical protein